MLVTALLGATIVALLAMTVVAFRTIRTPGVRRRWRVLAATWLLMASGRAFMLTLAMLPAGESVSASDALWEFTLAVLVLLAMTFGLHQFIQTRAMARELRDSERRLWQVFDDTRTGYLVWDEQSRPTLVNRALCTMVGYSRDELLSMSYMELIHADDRGDVTLSHERPAAQTPEWARLRLLSKGGAIVHVEARRTQFALASGAPGFLIELHDVSASVEADRALRLSEERHRVVTDTMRSGLLMMDEAGNLVFSNPALWQMFGYAADAREILDPVSRLWRHIPADEIQAMVARRHARLAGEPVESSYRARMFKRDGSEIWVDVAGSVVQLPDGMRGVLTEMRDVTDEVNALRAFEASEERHRVVTDTMRSGLVIIDDAGNAVFTNPAFLGMLGYEPGDAMSGAPADRLSRHVPAEDRDAAEAERRARAQGLVNEEPYRRRLLKRDGSDIWVDAVASRVSLADGKTGALTEMRDVTEEVKALRALEEAAERHRDVTDTMRSGLLIVDDDDNVVFQNPALLRMFGYEPGEAENVAPAERLSRHVPPDDRNAVLTQRRARADGVVSEEPYRRRRLKRDGTEIWVDAVASRVSLADGRTGVLTEMRDVTQEVQALHALEESEQRYRTLTETAQNGIVVIGPDGAAMLVNGALCRMLGYDRDELMSMNRMIEVLLPAERQAAVDRLAARVSGEITEEQYQTRMVHKSGAVIDVEISASQFVVGDRVVGALAEIRDTTEQVQLREQLLRAQKLEALGTLVAGVSHDFNNLLAAIGGSIEIAQEELPGSPWLERALVGTHRAADLVRQLLQFSRSDPTTRTAVDLRSVAAEATELLRETLDRRIEVALNAPPEPVTVSADRGQIHQVLMNLLVNARDAIDERLCDGDVPTDYQPTIVVTVASNDDRDGDEGEGHAAFTVADNGCGVPEEHRERIFDPFFTTKGPDEGTGLGLSTTYGIVHEHGGSVSLESSVGQGTTFRVELPRLSSAHVPSMEAPQEPPRVEANGGGLRLLVVDDEQALTEIAQRTLIGAGYEAVTATDGDSALELILSQDFDLIVLDVNMPAPNGWDVLDHLVESDSNQRVLMMSGFAAEREAKHRGAVGLLRKPFDRDSLLASVQSALLPAAS